MAKSLDSFNCRSTLKVGDTEYVYYSLTEAEKNGLTGIAALPFSMKVLLENLLRNEDGRTVKIWQITAKRIRVLFFYDKGHIVICTHGFIKKSGATPKAEKHSAISACKDYFTILHTDGSQ